MDVLYIRRDSRDVINVEIFNLSGILLKSVSVSDNRISVGDLTPGCYILKTAGHVGRFIKY